ncbi:tannase/feruloyl esterase family alpha/beta hydrolase [Gammaproteobacteria bacterium]|nr:tannase/feruloyl esterase family alpha/beta hydrolase [Gammaproteobacteria bacterium]
MLIKNTPNCLLNLKILLIVPFVLLISACAGDDSAGDVAISETSVNNEMPSAMATGMPQVTGASLLNCEALSSQFTFSQTVITSVTPVAAGPIPQGRGGSSEAGAHCLITGKMNERVSSIDNNTYAIGFEMRLPEDWNGRFFYHANGGVDGFVNAATGNLGGGQTTTALQLGYAVINSDAGHQGPAPFFGIDPQARIDYGYNAVATLTPMAKTLITEAYGKGPDRSYFAGCSNGGRHGMVAAARFADQYDGILAGNPGFNLPQAAVAQLYAVQQFTLVATSLNENGDPDISTAFTQAERNTIASSVLERCDGLDGLADGIIGDSMTCRAEFDLQRDVPTCDAERNGSCLSEDQKTVLGNIMGGARNSAGEPIYTGFPYDPGMAGQSWAGWKFNSSQSQNRDPGATAAIFTTPPFDIDMFREQGGYQFAMNFDMDTDAPKIYGTNELYTESPMSFMTPPNPNNMDTLRDGGSKLMVYHGMADGVFSPDDTIRWYSALNAQNAGNADEFARLYLVPGMGHCASGPSTDQFNMFEALVSWVEEGVAPDRVIASARGNNAEIPADWSTERTRPLCAFPEVARYNGSGDIEDAANFSCEAP